VHKGGHGGGSGGVTEQSGRGDEATRKDKWIGGVVNERKTRERERERERGEEGRQERNA